MKPDPILEEVWRIKDKLAADAGYDMSVFFQQLQQWTRENAELIRRVQSGKPFVASPAAMDDSSVSE